MPAVTLHTTEGSLLAFVLIAGNEELTEGSEIRECILTGAPQNPEDIDHPISVLRLKHLHLEHQAKFHFQEDPLYIEISLGDTDRLKITLPDTSDGAWELSGEGQSSGICNVVKPTQTKR